jgi:hypothetical protein
VVALIVVLAVVLLFVTVALDVDRQERRRDRPYTRVLTVGRRRRRRWWRR